MLSLAIEKMTTLQMWFPTLLLTLVLEFLECVENCEIINVKIDIYIFFFKLVQCHSLLMYKKVNFFFWNKHQHSYQNAQILKKEGIKMGKFPLS